MAFQQSEKDLESLELVKQSLIHKNELICHLQQEVDTWKQKYCSKEEEVQSLARQLNGQQSCYNTSDDIKGFGTFFVENPSASEVQVKEEAYEHEDWQEDETVQLGNKRAASESNEFTENVKKSRLDLEGHSPEETADLVFSCSSEGLPETAGSSNDALKWSSSVQQTQQYADQTSLGGASTEVSENVEHLESREGPPARGAPQAKGYVIEECSASNVGHLRARKDPGGDRPRQMTCSRCGSAFINQTGLDGHVCTRAGNERSSCPSEGCGSQTRYLASLRLHSRTDTGEKPFACTLEGCGYRCNGYSDMKKHIRTHTGEKPFACTLEGCGYRCNRSSDMKRHIRTHTGEKPFACTVEGCGFRSNGSSDMKMHIRRHTGEKPFACTVEGCRYRSNGSSHMKEHMRTHTGEKPFVCTMEGCGYRSNGSFDMKRHVRTHTGEKPFVCPVEGCGYRSARSFHMKEHMRAHTGEKPFVCSMEGCGYCCARSGNMKSHMLTHHGGNR